MSENKSRKLYYSMGEVAEMFDLNTTTIRFWANKFDIIKPHRNKKGNRMFTPADVENLKLIYHLVKERGMTLDGARKALKGNRDEILRKAEIVERLQFVRSLLLEIKQELNDDQPYEIFDADIAEPFISAAQEVDVVEEVSEQEFDEVVEDQPEDIAVAVEQQEDSVEEESVEDFDDVEQDAESPSKVVADNNKYEQPRGPIEQTLF